MKFINKLTAAALAVLTLASGVAITGCSDSDEFSTQQYRGGVSLNVFGPCPVARGGELRFLGSGMDQINSIEIPGCDAITEIKQITANEIRITVPQEAQPGKVVLNYPNGKITTQSTISFTEPISLDEMSPMSIKAGEILTIKGEYLNLIHEVIFADNVIVPETDFNSHSRNEISLIVPIEAQSGKIIISDAAEIPNWIYSEEELDVVLPSVTKVLDLTKMKPGNEVTVTGKDFDLVTTVTMPNGDEVEFKVNNEFTSLSFTLPANVSDGTICLIPASGVKVAAATIGVAVPEDVVAVPAENLWAGDELKLKGVNMEIVETVTFPGVATPVVPSDKKPTELTLKVPEGTQSGNLILTMGSGATVEVAISTLKPEAVAYNPSPAALAGTVKVGGRNLQNVVAIIFAGSTTVAVSNPSETSFEVVVPATLSAGNNSVDMLLSNGEVVSVTAIELTAPECAYATGLPSEDDEIKAGTVFTLPVANGTHLTGVLVNGVSVQYILNGTTLYISLPESCGKETTITLVSDNGTIEYKISVIPATEVEVKIWEGLFEAQWSGMGDLSWGGYDWSTVEVGWKLRAYFTIAPGAEYAQMRFGNGSWAALPGTDAVYSEGNIDIIKEFPNGVAEIEITPEIKDALINQGGLVMTGTNYVLSKLTLWYENSIETQVMFDWEYPVDMGNYSINLEGRPFNALANAGMKVGSTMHIYCTPTAAYNPADPQVHIQIFNGNWNMCSFPEIGGGTQFNEGNWSDMSKIDIKIDKTLYDYLTNIDDWGYCIIFQGNNIKINKVTIE